MLQTPGLRLAQAGIILAVLVAVGAITVAIVEGRFRIAVPVFLLAIGVVFVLYRWSSKAYMASVNRELRRQQAEPELHTARIPFEIRRGMGRRLPITLTVIFGVALAGALFVDPAFMVMIALLALPVLGISWGIAWFRSGQHVGTLDSTGFLTPRAGIPWTNVARIDLGREPKTDVPYLTFRLIEPLPARGWMDRINSGLSRGAADRELVVRLNHVRDDPNLLHEIAEELWRKAAGDTRADMALVAKASEASVVVRRFRDLPANERSRQIKAVFWISVIMLLTLHGVAADFYSSVAWLRMSGWIAAGLTALGLWLLLKGPGLASLRRGGGTISYFVMFLVVSATLALGSWSIVGWSLPDLATRAFGKPREMTVTLAKKSSDNTRKCRSLNGAGITNNFRFRYCASAAEYDALPSSGPMRIRARETWFGLHVDRIEPVDPLWNR